MRIRLLFLAVLVIVALVALPAVADAHSMGFSWTGSGQTYLDPATGLGVPIVGPEFAFVLESDGGYRGDYSLDGAGYVEVPLGETPVTLTVPLLSIHTVQTRLLYPTGEVCMAGQPRSFAIDNVGPRTTAVKPVQVRRDGYARFRFKLVDAGTPYDTMIIKVKTLKGRVVETLYEGQQATSTTVRSLRLKVALPTRKYRWFVYASDGCGNKQTLVGRNYLTVTR